MLFGTDRQDNNAGSFYLCTRDANKQIKLEGFPNGTLKWNNNKISNFILTSYNLKPAGGYLVFINGFVFQWALKNLSTSAQTNTFASWTYPIVFPSVGYAGDHIFPWAVCGTGNTSIFENRIPAFIFQHDQITTNKIDFEYTIFAVSQSSVTSWSGKNLNTKLYAFCS